MHPTAMRSCKFFFDTYANHIRPLTKSKIVEIGSQDLNGSLRSLAPSTFEYIGVDFAEGKGVDVILDSPYSLPFSDNSVDIVISSSCFEHSEMFWLVFLEIMRILKPNGLFYLNCPSNGSFHRHPVDCWRFFPDSGGALIAWAKHNSINAVLLESYISNQNAGFWNDYVAVFLKDAQYLSHYPRRILDNFQNFRNGMTHGASGFLNYSEYPEDLEKLFVHGLINNNTSS